MPHTRNRTIIPLFQKRLAFTRVVAIQGCRQSGKSFLARELLPKIAPGSHYITFDQKVTKTFAEENPESFLKKYEDALPLVIDEAQKVPDLFDALKFEVDQNPQPGRYVILGSTEFSKLLRIRESLTGRIGRLRLFPLTLSECLEISPSTATLNHLFNSNPRTNRSQVLKHLERGGFPGIFSVRDGTSRKNFFQDWLSLTLDRDLHQFPGISVNTDLALEIIQRIVLLPEPNATHIANAVKRDTRVVQKILRLLETLFVVHRLNPHREGNGKSLFFLCDVGLAAELGADFERQLWTWLLQEQLAQRSYRNYDGWNLSYFRSPKGKFVHLILENLRESQISAIKILSHEQIDLRDFEILKSFQKRIENQMKKINLIIWGPMSHDRFDKVIQIYPWESIV